MLGRYLRLLLFILSLVIFSCSNEESASYRGVSLGTTTISGEVLKPTSTQNSAQAVACSNAFVELYKIEDNGLIAEKPTDSSLINSLGQFKFTELNKKNVLLNANTTDYIIKANICGDVFYRPVTDYRNQKINGSSSLAGLTTEVFDATKKNIKLFNKQTMSNALEMLEKIPGDKLEQVVTNVQNNSEYNQLYNNLFNLSPTKLSEIPPINLFINVPTQIREGSSYTLSVSGTPWNSAYVPAYEWSINNLKLTTSQTLVTSFNENSAVSYTVTLKIGAKLNNGQLDLSKPIKVKNFKLFPADNFPIQLPQATLVGNSVRNFKNGMLLLNTGTNLSECKTFSKIAITQSQFIKPILGTDFNIFCNQSPTQNIPFTLEGADGLKTLALWAIDERNKISQTPVLVNTLLDTLPPSLVVSSPSTIKGQTLSKVFYKFTDQTSTVNSASVSFAADGLNFVALTNLNPTGTSFTWTPPAIDTASARLRFVATDQAGNVASMTTQAFQIDSTPPSLSVNFPTGNTTVSNTVSFAGTCESNLSVKVQQGPTILNVNCASNQFSGSLALSGADGVKSILFSQTDLVGFTTQVSVSINKDTTSPALTISTPLQATEVAKSFVIRGNCESGISVNFNSSALTESNSVMCTNGSYNKTLLFLPIEGLKSVLVTQTDSAGNSTSRTAQFLVDLTPPVLSITSQSLGTSPSTSLLERSISFGGASVTHYKAVLSSEDSCENSNPASEIEMPISSPFNFLPISDSKNIICAIGRDAAGNWQSTPTSSSLLVVDVTAPISPQSLSVPLSYNSTSQTPILSWTNGTDYLNGSGVSFYEIALGTTPNSTNVMNWTSVGLVNTKFFNINLVPFASTLIYPLIRTVDFVGFRSQVKVGSPWFVGVPDVYITTVSPSPNSFINKLTSSVEFNGLCSHPGRTVNITFGSNNLTAVCSTNKDWKLNASNSLFTEGQNLITVRHTDASNVADEKVFTITKDTVAPTVTFTSPTNNSAYNSANQSQFSIQGNCSENNKPVMLSSSFGLSTQTTCTSNQFSFVVNLSSRQEVALSFQAQQIDLAGNFSAFEELLLKNTVYQKIQMVNLNAPLRKHSSGGIFFGETKDELFSYGAFRGDSYNDISVLKTDGSQWNAITSIQGRGSVSLSNSSSPPVFSTKYNKLVYRREVTGVWTRYQLWSSFKDGSNDMLITGTQDSFYSNKKSTVLQAKPTPSGDTLVVLADFKVRDKFELFAIEADGSNVRKLSGNMTALGDVSEFIISPDGKYAVYIADESTNNVPEIFSVAIDGQTASVKLNEPFTTLGRAISSPKISPNSLWVSYRTTQNTTSTSVGHIRVSKIDGSLKYNPTFAATNKNMHSASFSNDSTKLAYTMQISTATNYRYYVSPIDLTSQTSLTNNFIGATALSFPIWSPDDSKLLLQGAMNIGATYELYSVNSDGTNLARLTTGVVSGGSVRTAANTDFINYKAFTPNGQKIVFSADLQNNLANTDASYSLYTVNTDGSDLTKIVQASVEGAVEHFIISPDSQKIIFWSDINKVTQFELFSINIDGSQLVKLNPNIVRDNGDVSIGAGYSLVDWNVGQLYFACICGAEGFREIFKTNLNTNTTTPYLLPFEINGSDISGLTLSPDSQKLAVRAYPQVRNRTQLFVTNTNSNQYVNVTPQVTGLGVQSVVFSPDSQKIAFTADLDFPNQNIELYIVNSDGSQLRKLNSSLQALGNIQAFKFTPDSQKIIYRADAEVDESSELYSVNVDGTQLTKLNSTFPIPLKMGVTDFIISPNSQKVVYSSDEVTDDVFRLFSINTDGTSKAELTPAVIVGGGDVSTTSARWTISNDSTRVYYIGDTRVDGALELFGVNIDGTNRIQLSQNGTSSLGVTDLYLSPNDQWIAYRGDLDVDGNFDLWLVPSAGGSRQNLTVAKVTDGSLGASSVTNPPVMWTPDSSRILFTAFYNNIEALELFSATPQGQIIKLSGDLAPTSSVGGLSTSDATFRISPLGNKTTYVSDEEIAGQYNLYSINFDGSNKTKLVNLPSWANIMTFNYIPNTSRLVIKADLYKDNVDTLYVLNDDGTNLANISFPANLTSFIQPDFVISTTDNKVYFRADIEKRSVYELWKTELPPAN